MFCGGTLVVDVRVICYSRVRERIIIILLLLLLSSSSLCLLHLVSKVITFCVTITFFVKSYYILRYYYILWRDSVLKERNRKLERRAENCNHHIEGSIAVTFYVVTIRVMVNLSEP